MMISTMKYKDQVTDFSWTSIDELACLISKLDMTVSVDTGPIFMAEASGVPTIDIGGVIEPHDMAPNDGDKHILITYGGEPLLWSMNSRFYDYEKARAGIESITVGQVTEQCSLLLERQRRS